MTKFLVHGNAPFVATGYGIQIEQLTQQLLADGHEPAVSVTYGLQGTVLDRNGIRLYGCGFDTQSNDRVHMHADHWFREEPGWIITCVDVWGLQNPVLAEYNVAAWVPVDHYTSVGPQPNVREFFARTNAVPIAMSRFGEDLLRRAGLDPLYVPLSVDTSKFKPTPVLPNGMTGRDLMEVPEDAFVVTMVGMNKGWAKDRKGFSEAFHAFGMFEHDHPNAYLYMHSEKFGGAEGQNLVNLAVQAGIPEYKLKWAGGPNQYGILGLDYTPEMMAAVYTATDVLLAPSHGEGFCVPLIEAQACGTPVIATAFSAQRELVTDDCGWLVQGQPEWDPAHHALYLCPYIGDIVIQLEAAYDADRAAMADARVTFAAQYDTQYVYETYWKPALKELTAAPDVLPLDREPMPDNNAVDVLCPIYKRTSNIAQLCQSFVKNTPPEAAHLWFIVDGDDTAAIEAINASREEHGWQNVDMLMARDVSCAAKWNTGYAATRAPWVLCIGDDVRFHDGWLDAARKLSGEFDVIGTNDTADKPKNVHVARGSHADHFFVRRAYVEEYGASLEGPGILAPEVYRHWFVDMEIVKLARARGVFSPCLDSVVEHLHPGYDGREDLREQDPTYMVAVEHQESDAAAWETRRVLVEQQRTNRANL